MDMSDNEHIFHIVKKPKVSIVFVCLDNIYMKKKHDFYLLL